MIDGKFERVHSGGIHNDIAQRITHDRIALHHRIAYHRSLFLPVLKDWYIRICHHKHDGKKQKGYD